MTCFQGGGHISMQYSLSLVLSFEWRFYVLLASIRPYSGWQHTAMITGWMKLRGNLPPGHDALPFPISGTGSLICLVAQTLLNIPRPLFRVMNHCWGGESKCSGTRQIRTADLSVHSRTRQPPDHDDCPKSEDKSYPGSSTGGGGLLPILLWSSVKTAPHV